MNTIEDIEDHMAYTCECGCVRFCLLRSGLIECQDCRSLAPFVTIPAERATPPA